MSTNVLPKHCCHVQLTSYVQKMLSILPNILSKSSIKMKGHASSNALFTLQWNNLLLLLSTKVSLVVYVKLTSLYVAHTVNITFESAKYKIYT